MGPKKTTDWDMADAAVFSTLDEPPDWSPAGEDGVLRALGTETVSPGARPFRRSPKGPPAESGEDAVGLVGESPAIVRARRQIVRLAGLPVNVLILGETGTGKELVAQALHRLSPWAEAPFIAVNCAAIPEHLLESELFGYRRGAFTGAERDTPGLIERAGPGTVFFDEIGDMSPYHQAKILRVLQEKKVRRVGDDVERPVRCRFVFATHAPLEERVRQGKFRKDLYFRIRTPYVRLPALRERREDIPLLVEFFLQKYRPLLAARVRRIHPGVWNCLLRYPWPGNVRELESVLVSALVEAHGDAVLRPEHLPPEVRAGPTAGVESDPWTIPVPRLRPLAIARAEFERQYVQLVLQEMGFDKSRSAQVLGICRATLYHILDGRRGPTVKKTRRDSPGPGPELSDRPGPPSADPGSPASEARTGGGS